MHAALYGEKGKQSAAEKQAGEMKREKVSG